MTAADVAADAAPTTEPPLCYTLGGRIYVMSDETTFEQDLWILAHINDAQLHQLPPDEGLTDTAIALISKAYRSGHLFFILAGILVEKGKRWSPQVAELVAQRFAELKDPNEKKILQSSMVGVLTRFFVTVAGSLTSSASRSPSPAAPAGDGASSGAREPSASGTRSSVSSPDTIPPASTAS
jgi:hypothetical protein